MKTTLILATLFTLLIPVSAGPARNAIRKEVKEKNSSIEPDKRMPAADARIAKMKLLITGGTKNGKLTKAETGSLTREVEQIEQREEQFRRSMDKVTPGERRKLNRDITDLHQRIHDKTHNAAKVTEKPAEKK